MGALVKLSPTEGFKIGKRRGPYGRIWQWEGYFQNHQKTSSEDYHYQERMGWSITNQGTFRNNFFSEYLDSCHFTAYAVYFDWPQFESENVSLLRDLRLRSSYHGFNLWIILFTPPVFLFWFSTMMLKVTYRLRLKWKLISWTILLAKTTTQAGEKTI